MLFFPRALFSQYLEPEDIAIFIDNYVSIGQAHVANGIYDDPAWDNYHRLGKETLSRIDGISRDSPPGDRDALQRLYAEFMNCQIPVVLERAYRKAGWKHNGHQKFFAVIYGIILVITEISSVAEDAELLQWMGAIVHKQDAALIRNHLDDLQLVFLG